MKRIRIIGLAIVAVFALSAVAASGASAFTTWDVEGSPVTAPVETTSESAAGLTLSSGGTTVVCKGTDTGTVEPEGKDKVNTITVNTEKDCTVTVAGFCESLINVKPVNLPWNTKLVGEKEDEILPSTAGKNPGWAVTCSTILGEKTVTCTAPHAHVEVVNNAGKVETVFKEKVTENAACEGGTSSEGTVRGIDLIQVPGKKLSAN
jgi:hypothetical protein